MMLWTLLRGAKKCIKGGNYGLARQILETFVMVHERRYLERPIAYAPRDDSFFTKQWVRLTESALLRMVRVTRATFGKVVQELMNTECFENNVERCTGTPIWKMAVVALTRFGHYGNASSLAEYSDKFGVSATTVVNWTDRIVAALMELMHRWIVWPTAAERQQLCLANQEAFGIPNCVGIVDGTMVNLRSAPHVQGHAFFTRKGRYSFNVQLIVTATKRIIGCAIGSVGSTHDLRAFKTMPQYKQYQTFFDKQQFLLGDLGYRLLRMLQPLFTFGAAGIEDFSQADIDAINKLMSKLRVIVEHANGLLKGRWQSLRGLSHQIKTRAAFADPVKWIGAICVLHNMTLQFNEPVHPDGMVHDDDEPALINLPDADDVAAAADPVVIEQRRKIAVGLRGRVAEQLAQGQQQQD